MRLHINFRLSKFTLFTILTVLIFAQYQPVANAIDDNELKSILQGTTFYDPNGAYCGPPQQNTFDLGADSQDVPTTIFKTNPSLANDARVWQFLTSPEGLGLSATAAGGFMGNIRQESGGNFDPNIIEGGNGAGYGIIQWTGGRRTAVENYIQSVQATDPTLDLMDIQLSYLRKELTTTYKDTYSMLKTATAVYVTEKSGNKITYKEPLEVSTMATHGSSGVGKFTVSGLSANFIASGDDLSEIIPGNRYKYAVEYFEKFTGQTTDTINAVVRSDCTHSNTGPSGQAGIYGWDLEGPNKMTYYIQAGQPWSDYPFSGCGDIGTCGCPVVTVASIISTLTQYKQDPQEIMEEWGRGFYSDYPTKEKYGLTKTIIKKANGTADWNQAIETLKSGGLIMAHAYNGTFTTNEHWFVIRKVSEDGNSFYVYDLRNPKSEDNNKAFTRQELLGSGNINVLYGFTK